MRTASSRISNTQRFFATSPSPQATTTLAQRRKLQDPYAQAQARARRAANLSRQEVLQTERNKALGDPVRGITTPFVESFDTAIPPISQNSSEPISKNIKSEYLNHFVSNTEFRRSLTHSDHLSSPIRKSDPTTADPEKEEAAAAAHRQAHQNAQAAISRILSLDNTSSKDRTRVNIQRCIETFGRHNTDQTLRPRPDSAAHVAAMEAAGEDAMRKTPRAGPDTGSSEVQIAILTAKIRTLANFLEGRGRKDKVNKRNLRLLVHKRQKLLAYLRKKERGGERWQHLIGTLGLTEGTWQGEISL